LIVQDIFTCELAKMAVDNQARGNGIGCLLGIALLEKARERCFSRVVLEGNTKMAASISLYRKLGFKEISLASIDQKQAVHTRCNIFMELKLNPYDQSEYTI